VDGVQEQRYQRRALYAVRAHPWSPVVCVVFSVFVAVHRLPFFPVFLVELWITGARTLCRTAGQCRAALVLEPKNPQPLLYSKQVVSAMVLVLQV
jgi:hypothetical protein